MQFRMFNSDSVCCSFSGLYFGVTSAGRLFISSITVTGPVPKRAKLSTPVFLLTLSTLQTRRTASISQIFDMRNRQLHGWGQ